MRDKEGVIASIQSSATQWQHSFQLGITMEDGFVKIISPIDDTPAQRAGLKAGDLVIEVQGISLKDKSINDAVKLMRGEPGT